MASEEEITAVVAELPEDAADYGWTRDYIGGLLDDGISGNPLLVKFWKKVSTDTSSLVDMSESGSSRSLSQIHKNAMDQVKFYQGIIDKETGATSTATGIRSRVITRV